MYSLNVFTEIKVVLKVEPNIYKRRLDRERENESESGEYMKFELVHKNREGTKKINQHPMTSVKFEKKKIR